MNFNKSMLRIANRYPLLQISLYSRRCNILSTWKSHNTYQRSRTIESCFNRTKVLSQPISLTFYSTAANEEQIKTKNTDSALSVPPLQFKDATFDSPVIHSDLCDALQICDSIEEQMYVLTSTLALNPDDIENRLRFSKEIESYLKTFFGDIRIQMFGSTVNGFGFKGCDIDMSFQTFAEQKEEISYIEAPDVPLVSEVTSGKISPQEIALLPPKEQLLFIHSIFLEFYKESEEPTIFINAHVPLIRFYHDRFGLKCDLTCRNKVAFANSKLMYLFGKLDERVIPLMMTIRYWAKHVELIGKGLLFNTYTISLLVIHFLQTRSPPVLPSAEHILSISDSLSIDDMSDNSFLQIKRHIPPSENNQTVSELLRDFFFYYVFFDFSRVICPLIGGSVPREQFFSTASKRFRMNSICIQDPMMLTHNVAELVDYKICKKFSTESMIACQMFKNSSIIAPSSYKWGISYLLDKPNDAQNSMYQRIITVTVPRVTKPITDSSVAGDANLLTADTLLYLLREVLLFECNHLNMQEIMKMLKVHDEAIERQMRLCEAKYQRMSEAPELYRNRKNQLDLDLALKKISQSLMLEEFQKFSAENNLVSCFQCRAVANIWIGRDQVSLDSLPINVSNGLVEKERFVSVNAAKQNELTARHSKRTMEPFLFSCECYASQDSSETLLLKFRPFQKTHFNPFLGIFLEEYLPKFVKNLNEIC